LGGKQSKKDKPENVAFVNEPMKKIPDKLKKRTIKNDPGQGELFGI